MLGLDVPIFRLLKVNNVPDGVKVLPGKVSN